MAIFCLVFVHANAQSSADIQAYIDKYKQIALRHEKEYGIPAPITLAQGILESGAGLSKLASEANNHFGIKALGNWQGNVYLAWDDEIEKSRFRSYASAEESFKDHAMLLKNSSRYETLFLKNVYDYRGWAYGLQQAGYATATNYAKAIIGYIDAYKLYAINGGVKLKPGKTVTIVSYRIDDMPVFDADCQISESDRTEEESNVTAVISRFVVEINNVRCTILYPGETLSSVSQKYDISRQELLKFNEVGSEGDIHEGDIVFLQEKKNKYQGAQDFYRLKNGETLYDVSQQFGIKLASLSKLNGLGLFSKLSAGQRIMLK